MAHLPPGSLYAAARGKYPACLLFKFQSSAKDKKLPLINLFIFEAKRQELHSLFQKFLYIIQPP
jgi:hypothetical protein